MSELVKIVIPKVAAHWNTLAYCLEFEIETVKFIEVKYSNNPEKSCKEVFIHWLTSNEGISPKNWEVLLKTLKEITELMAISEQIEKELEQGIFEPGMHAWFLEIAFVHNVSMCICACLPSKAFM